MGAEQRARAQRADQRGQRLLADLGVLGRAVEEVDGVDQERVHVGVPRPLRETPRSPPRSTRAASTARGFWLKIWMERAPRSVPRSTAFAGPPLGETWAPISILRGGSSMLLRCSGSASPPRPPARSTSAARAPRSTTGCSRAGRAGSSCCGSRTRTASAPPRRTSARSSRRSSGWGSTTTASPSSSPGAPTATARSCGSCSTPGSRTAPPPGPDEVRAFKEANGNRGFRGADEGEGAVRLRVPDEGVTTVVDVVRGETPFENALQDDLVIARADGSPVYHLAVVVDDADAGITHVVRGADHYSNTPKHVLIQQAMGAATPVYAHLPLLHGPDGKKLSKRHGAASVQDLRDAGYLPEAVRNYLALLGWGYDEETTFFTTEQLQELFTLERVSKSPAVFDEQKLRWINGRYVREMPVSRADRAAGGAARPHGPGGGRRGHAGEDLHARRVLAAGALVLRGPGRRSRSTREIPRAGGGRAGAHRRPRGARRGAGPVDHRVGRDRAARGGRAVGDEGEGGVPAASRRADRDDHLTGHLRDRRPHRAGPRADADRRRTRRPPRRLIDHSSDRAHAQRFVHVCR